VTPADERSSEFGGEPSPWYRHFWPWFIVLLLGVAVTGSIVTGFIAFTNQESLVSDDWYEDGTTINRRLAREENARSLGIWGELRVDPMTGEVRLDLRGEITAGLQHLELAFAHPTQSARDRSMTLARTPAGDFAGQLERPLSGRWYATLGPSPSEAPSATDATSSDASDDDWRLRETLLFPSEGGFTLGEAVGTPP